MIDSLRVYLFELTDTQRQEIAEEMGVWSPAEVFLSEHERWNQMYKRIAADGRQDEFLLKILEIRLRSIPFTV